MSERQDAIDWWNRLNRLTRIRLALHHGHGSWTPAMLSASTSSLLKIFKAENPKRMH